MQSTTTVRVSRRAHEVLNELASSDPEDLEPLVGMSHLSGIPVRAEALVAAQPS